jgi:hypothetical protein
MKNTIKSLKLKLKKKPKGKPIRFNSISLKKASFNTGHITVFNNRDIMIAVIGKHEKPKQFFQFSEQEKEEITNVINNFDKIYKSL